MELAEALEHLERRFDENKLFAYRPYGHPDTLCPDGVLWRKMSQQKKSPWASWSNKPWQLNFLNASAENQELMLCASNRSGKTQCGGTAVAMHATGIYPDWYKGKRFDKPILVWTGSPTNETSREIVQKALIGGTDSYAFGTGWIPKDLIVGKPKMRQAGVSDVVDVVKVRHATGGISTITFKTYQQGWRTFQGTEPEVVWLDEEPDESADQKRIYSECLTRLLTSHGIMLVTFTPLLGQTELVRHFQSGGKGIYFDGATWDDAPHLNKEERDRLAASYPDHEIQARTQGVPLMGEGAVFDTPETEISIPPIEIPPHFGRIKGIDFGLDHPSALADCAWDRDRDIWYVTRVWRKNGVGVTDEHCEAINAVDPWVPVSWPHDGTQREKRNGQRIKDYYAVDKGVKMLSMSARYKKEQGGGQPVEPIVLEMQQRAREGRLKVFSTCTEFFDEYRNYHRKDGKIVAKRDDVLKSVMYALMMKRFASTPPRRGRMVHRMPMPLRT